MGYHFSFGLHKAKLPTIPIEIKEQYLCFILDAGSTCNLIDSTVIEYFKDTVEPAGDYCINGIEGTKHKVDVIILPFNSEGQVYKPRSCVRLLLGAFKSTEDESEIQVYGLIGIDFSLENKWVTNFEKLELVY